MIAIVAAPKAISAERFRPANPQSSNIKQIVDPSPFVKAWMAPVILTFCGPVPSETDYNLNVHGVSITCELFDTDVVIVYARFMEHSSHAHDHGRRSGQVINCLLDILEIPGQHLTD